jgi:alkylated DNA nucleotide flippase Atl1
MASQAELAQDIFPVLVKAAHAKETLTYGQVAERIGRSGQGRLISGSLQMLHNWAVTKKLPAITVIVVNAKSREIGSWLANRISDPTMERQTVFKFDWSKVGPQQAEFSSTRTMKS